jgi:hypothetical protein
MMIFLSIANMALRESADGLAVFGSDTVDYLLRITVTAGQWLPCNGGQKVIK